MDDDGRMALRQLLDNVQYLVLDEADRLLGRAFHQELDACLELLPLERLPETWLFSATFPKSIEPRVDHVLRRLGQSSDIQRLSCSNSDRIAHNDEEVSATLQKRLEKTASAQAAIEQVGPASTIHLRTIRLEQPKRTQALRKLLEDHPEWDRVLVFVATRYASQHVARKLRRAGIQAAELHGKLQAGSGSAHAPPQGVQQGQQRLRPHCHRHCQPGNRCFRAPRRRRLRFDPLHGQLCSPHRTDRAGWKKAGTAVTFLVASEEAHLDLIEARHLAAPVEGELLKGFVVWRSSFVVRCLAFVVWRSAFAVRRSSFVVWRSAFVVRRSAWSNGKSRPWGRK